MSLLRRIRRWRARIDPREYFYWKLQAKIRPLLHELRTQGWRDAAGGNVAACEARSAAVERIEQQVERLKRLGWYGGRGGWSWFIPTP